MERAGKRGVMNRRVERAFDASRLEQEHVAAAYGQILPELAMRPAGREERTMSGSVAVVDEPQRPAALLRCA